MTGLKRILNWKRLRDEPDPDSIDWLALLAGILLLAITLVYAV